ncbi:MULTISPECIES: DinB family protein [unclassified Oceanispirochaeta]|uniref:DinB family protein n=1 Tax=unclassified Oceanispirochaeta TaxID=2635722 RepID=UPI000E08DE81|nr:MULTISPECIES: DinB family protein [unclassified Oceanispirochaeta]MBF9018928.1 DinB family protein [Oceanispirochaeta sp. M2]NPD75427.1 hypothetical protein [Oceanispirochaeta sp. M1]RDG28712.1 hypothetical protein DV872_25375 [Oceanispirochaeta sp. M1]
MIDFKRSIVQLENNKFIFENLILGIFREQANWKPDEERWSIIEILNHLIDIEIEDFRYNLNLILFSPEKEWPSRPMCQHS